MTTCKPFFEVFERSNDATCFQCCGGLVDPSFSGFSFGNGNRQGYCCACRMVTFFDVPDEVEETEDADAVALATDVVIAFNAIAAETPRQRKARQWDARRARWDAWKAARA